MSIRVAPVDPIISLSLLFFSSLVYLQNQNQMATFLGYSRDTVAVALNYFDRYTCATACPPTLAQAVAATALHVAAKFEETQPASLVRRVDERRKKERQNVACDMFLETTGENRRVWRGCRV